MSKGVVSGGNPQSVMAGSEVLKAGGNACDAALAALICSFFTEPTLTSPGGGGFAMVKSGDSLKLHDFFCQTPGSRPKMEVDFKPIEVTFGTDKQTFQIGLGSIAVPGTIAGIFDLHSSYGRMGLLEIAQAGMDLGRGGYTIDSFQAYCLTVLEKILAEDEFGRQHFFEKDKLKKEGDKFSNPSLANFMEELLREGPRLFYEGEPANWLHNAFKAGRSCLSADDLKRFRSISREPQVKKVLGSQIFLNPSPSSGGSLIGFALKYFEKFHWPQFQRKGITGFDMSSFRAFQEAFQKADRARVEGLDPFIHDAGKAKHFSSDQNVDAWGSTTHLNAVDSEGMMVAITSTTGAGAGYFLPGSGIMLNNMLGESDLNPGGFHNWPLDHRLSSMMSPTIIQSPSNEFLALGTGGANRIRTALSQVILRHLRGNLSLEEILAAPRLHSENGKLWLEKGWDFDEQEHFSNAKIWPGRNMFFGGVHCAGIRQSEFFAAGDPRRNGAFALA